MGGGMGNEGKGKISSLTGTREDYNYYFDLKQFRKNVGIAIYLELHHVIYCWFSHIFLLLFFVVGFKNATCPNVHFEN